MNELYWLTRLDGIHEFLNYNAIIFTTLCVVFVIIWGIMIINAGAEGDDVYKYKFYNPVKRWTFGSFIVGSLFWLGIVFLPTTKEACMIYLGGSVIDYVQGNEKIREIPDKVVVLASDYLDELITSPKEKITKQKEGTD